MVQMVMVVGILTDGISRVLHQVHMVDGSRVVVLHQTPGIKAMVTRAMDKVNK
jgi:hypothetical protein